jgi:hypothetical protein
VENVDTPEMEQIVKNILYECIFDLVVSIQVVFLYILLAVLADDRSLLTVFHCVLVLILALVYDTTPFWTNDVGIFALGNVRLNTA